MADRENLTPVGFRLPDELIERVDAYSRSVEQRMPGVRMSRSNAIRALLESALAAAGFPPAAEAPKGKRGK